MQTHEMKLVARPFEDIVSGKKRYELRLNDEKRKQLKISDRIVFRKLLDLVDSVIVEVVSLKVYSDFSSMFEDLKIEYPDWKKSDWVNDKYAYYTPEEEHQFGVLAIGFRLV